MEKLVNTLFYPTKNLKKAGWGRNITAYGGKHYMEAHLGTYVSSEEFEILMEKLGHKQNEKQGMYYLRPRKEFILKYS